MKETTRVKLAIGKNFEQSSTVENHTAEKAIDYFRKSYSETNKEAEAWWRVDLGTSQVVDEVRYLSNSRSVIHVTIISFVVSIWRFVEFSFSFFLNHRFHYFLSLWNLEIIDCYNTLRNLEVSFKSETIYWCIFFLKWFCKLANVFLIFVVTRSF